MVTIKRYQIPQIYTRRAIFGLAAGYALYRSRSTYASHSVIAGRSDGMRGQHLTQSLWTWLQQHSGRANIGSAHRFVPLFDQAIRSISPDVRVRLQWTPKSLMRRRQALITGGTAGTALPYRMMNAWKLHQASSDRHRMNWCLLLQFARMGGPIAFSGVVSTYVGYFLQANYQKVLFGRPLIYIYFDQMSHLESNWNGDWANVRIALDGLRAACARKELPVPYIVIMSGAPSVAYSVMSAVAGDAISNYIGPVPSGEPARTVRSTPLPRPTGPNRLPQVCQLCRSV